MHPSLRRPWLVAGSAAFSSDGTSVLIASSGNTAKLWRSAAFSRYDNSVLTTCRDSAAKLWNTESGAHIETFAGYGDCVRSTAFSGDGASVVTTSFGSTTNPGAPRAGNASKPSQAMD